jgi:hypothetical protein
MDDKNRKTNIPLGLNIEDFMPVSPMNHLPKEILTPSIRNESPEKQKIIIPFDKDNKIIEGIFKDAPNYKVIINKRIKNLINIDKIWNDGRNKKETFELLLEIEDMDVINDIINFYFIKTELKHMDVRSKEIVIIFPVLIKMITSKYDIYFKNGILASWKILQYLKRVIIETKQNQYIYNKRNIDLEKEAKIKIYDKIINYYKEIKNLDNIGIYLNKDSKIVGFNLADFICELDEFLRACQL